MTEKMSPGEKKLGETTQAQYRAVPMGYEESQNRSKKYVLVVDDEEHIRALLCDLLEDDGIHVYEAEDGEVALDYVRSHKIDLVISDVRMPGMSGVDLLTEIRKRFPSLPVLIVTGEPSLDAAVDCMRSGAIDYLTKPFDVMQVEEMVRDALSGNQQLEREQKESIRYHRLQKMGDYQIDDTIGEGASGVVFRAQKDGLDYALKVFKFASSENQNREELEERFVREARFLDRMDHPNIVSLVEYGFSDDQIPYVVMNYIRGENLRAFRKRELSVKQKLQIVRQVALALEVIHEQDVIHRDIKPDNIMVNDELQVTLTDFGIIRMPDSELTMIAHVVGSPAYLAPEGFVSPQVGFASDIFSLGVVAYELLTGRRPFIADDFFALATKVQSELPPRPSSLVPELTPEIDEMLGWMLRKSPHERFQSIEDVLQYLNFLLAPEEHARPNLSRIRPDPDWAGKDGDLDSTYTC